MKLPYGYVLDGEKIVIHEERAEAVRSIFECYLAGASLGKVVEMLKIRNGQGQRWTSSCRMQNIFQSLV